ncbi:DUF6063 family protein [Clostridium perfringens]
MDENYKIALEIFTKVIRNIPINEKNNEDLYNALTRNSFVMTCLEELLSMLDLDLYINETDGVFVAAKPNNTIFGYKNQELKEKIGLRYNSELYLAYFIMYSVISTFYIQSNYRTQVEFITSKSLLDNVEEKLKALSENCNLSVEYESSFKNLYSVWSGMPESAIKDKDDVNFDEKRGKTKLSIVNKTLDFLVEQGFMDKDEHTSRFSINSKFEFVIERFFEDSNTNQVLIDLLEEEKEKIGGNKVCQDY